MNESKNQLIDRNVLVTGADGFIGSHLVQQLVAYGANVTALVYYNSWNQIGWLNTLSSDELKKINISFGDVRDYGRISDLTDGTHYVFHLSSLIGIPYSYHAVQSYFDTNVSGALSVLAASKKNKNLIRLLHVSTSEVYGSAQFVPITELHPLVGQSPYAASKIAADKLVESYHLSFGLPVVTARPFNTFGPRQTARAVIPTIASQIISGASELRLGSLTPTRDFNYVTDTVEGMIALALCKKAEGLTVNIGTGIEHSIGDVVNTLLQYSGSNAVVITDSERVRPINSEVNRLIADSSLLRGLTDWRPSVTFDKGLEYTFEWIKRNMMYFKDSGYKI